MAPSICQVGGKFRSVKKCREIAQGATDALREGQSLETVRSMVVSYTSLVLFCILWSFKILLSVTGTSSMVFSPLERPFNRNMVCCPTLLRTYVENKTSFGCIQPKCRDIWIEGWFNIVSAGGRLSLSSFSHFFMFQKERIETGPLLACYLDSTLNLIQLCVD